MSDVIFQIIHPNGMSAENFSAEEIFSVLAEASGSGQQNWEDNADNGNYHPTAGLTQEYYDRHQEVERESEKHNRVIDIFALIEEKRRHIKPVVKITPLSVSTQSAKAKMSCALNLEELSITITESIQEYIVGGKRKDFSITGVKYHDNQEGVTGGKASRGCFPNNAAVLVRSPMGTGRTVNIKVFKNGSISMTGCKIKEDGIAAVKILEKYLIKQNSLFETKKQQKEFRITNFEITMINSDYKIGFNVDRKRLYDVICKHYPKVAVTYDPVTYSGVKLGFFYNGTKGKDQNGICGCPRICKGKGTGREIGKCKKVTVSVFQSGKIINTGGREMCQTLAAYRFMNDVIKRFSKEIILINYEDVEKESLTNGQVSC
jgi:TATA-box binding protein (TBP) (component of TFIID and TFIIIB)